MYRIIYVYISIISRRIQAYKSYMYRCIDAHCTSNEKKNTGDIFSFPLNVLPLSGEELQGHVRNDELVDPAAAKAFYEQAVSQRKAFETEAFSSSAHELHNEVAHRPLISRPFL